MNWRKKLVVILDVVVWIQLIHVCHNKICYSIFIGNKFFVVDVGDSNDKSSTALNDGFSSVKIRNRPPLPVSNSATSCNKTFIQNFLLFIWEFFCFIATRHDSTQLIKPMRNWLQRSQSENEVISNEIPDAGNY